MAAGFNDPDVTPDFVQKELEATWERAGKGRELWKPGDKTDSPLSDARLLFTTWKLNPLQLHIYDHCPFCLRARLVLGWLQIPHTYVVYGYGAGADPAKCDGFGYGEGPLPLVGKKALPVLTGAGIPSPKWVHQSSQVLLGGLPESLDICSFAGGVAKDGKIAPATGRAEIKDWLSRMDVVSSPLLKPRTLKLPIQDWADERDVAYAKWKYEKAGVDLAAAMAETDVWLKGLTPLLQELETMLMGEYQLGSTAADGTGVCLHEWGLSMDDAMVVPVLRNLSVVKGIEWPDKVKAYYTQACAKAGVSTYEQYAC